MVLLHFNKDASVIIVDVRIRGSNNVVLNLKMALDTAATCLSIPSVIAEKLGFESATTIDIVTVSGKETVATTFLPLVSVGGLSAINVKTVVHDLPDSAYVDGLLGLSFLRNFNIFINFKEQYIELN